jgi:hypothetical protein
MQHDPLPRSSLNPVRILCERWQAARPTAGGLPAYGEIALGNLGRLADRTALIRVDAGDLTILRMAPLFEAWLHGAPSDRVAPERSDCGRLLRQSVRRALARSQPERHTASRVEDGIVERYEILALPLLTKWGFPVVLVYVGALGIRASLIERVYQSTHEGLVAFTPVRDDEGRVSDLQIVTLNAGSSARTSTASPLGCSVWSRPAGRRISSSMTSGTGRSFSSRSPPRSSTISSS